MVGIQWASGGWLEELQVPIGSPEFFSLSIDERDVWDRVGKEEKIKEERSRPEAQQQRRIDAGQVLQLARRLMLLPRLRTLKLLWMDPIVPIDDVLKCQEEERQEGVIIEESFLQWIGLK
jgi:hypothetical protein